ncbi:flavin containing amine oxidoreductase domain-containing protein [Phthorimaea operculella]|nr:flavin containing amine oxidoreductase domain-containing protein [Phthorimaea operculella]
MAAILGGGLAGLSTGYYLIKNNVVSNNNLKLILYEASKHCGGWIRTSKNNDYTFEQGPRTIRPKGVPGTNTLNMIQDLGLSEHIWPITHDHPAAKNRMIYANNNLHVMPSSLLGVFQKKKPFSKPLIYAIFHDIMEPGGKGMQDDSIYNFVARRFGRDIADYAISPMICGICAGDAKEISVKFLMKNLFEHEQNHGGVLKGVMKTFFKSKPNQDNVVSALARRAQEEKWNVYTLKGGLETFPKTLHNYLKENDVIMNLDTKIDKLEFIDSNTAVLRSQDKAETVNHVYASIPAFRLADLVEHQHPKLASLLKEIPFVTVGLVNLYFSEKSLTPEAFGFLVPPIEDSPILGVVFDSCCLPDQNGTVLTVMLGGRWFEERFGKKVTGSHLLDVALKEIYRIMDIAQKPDVSSVNILDRCIPQYIIGHYERVEAIRDYIKNEHLPMSLVGCSYDGVGINDVIYSAKTQVEQNLSVFRKETDKVSAEAL